MKDIAGDPSTNGSSHNVVRAHKLKAPSLTGNSMLLWVCVVVIYTLIWGVFALNGIRISHEHGPMENTQAGFLCAGFLLLGGLAIRLKTRGHRILFATLALFYASFFLREVEVEDLNIPRVLILLGSGPGKKYLLVTCWLVAAGFFLCYPKETWSAFKKWLKTFAGLTIILGGVFYLLGMPFDKKAFDIQYDLNVLLEEMLESVAALWMLIAAIMSMVQFRNSGPES
ncbi:MAG: hypothetical protein ACU84Q_16680 [Gammaproteobacteria bacterium]